MVHASVLRKEARRFPVEETQQAKAGEQVLSWIANSHLEQTHPLFPTSPRSKLASHCPSEARSDRLNPDLAKYIQLHHALAMTATNCLDLEIPPTMDVPKHLPLIFAHAYLAREVGEENPNNTMTRQTGAYLLEVGTFL